MTNANIMRMSELCVPTLKEDPTDAEIASHKLLLRAGMIRKTASGVYTFLPLGKRVLAKVERIVREVEQGLPPTVPDYELAGLDAFPGARVPVAVPAQGAGGPGRLAVAELDWGYPVSWAKRPVFNTRVDTATGPRGQMWRESLEQRRCAVPTLGFYEPHRTERAVSPKTGREVKVQCAFGLPDNPVTFLGGIYEDGHFSIMTCEPNRWVRDVHDRMPLVLRPSELGTWLGPRYADLFDRRDVELACRVA